MLSLQVVSPVMPTQNEIVYLWKALFCECEELGEQRAKLEHEECEEKQQNSFFPGQNSSSWNLRCFDSLIGDFGDWSA
jgi:hypothetical protein